MTEPTLASSIRGLNHLALVCSDMARTVDFYSGVLGFPLVKTVERALARFQDRDEWVEIQRRGLRQDHSWDVSAAKYVKLYEGLQPVAVVSTSTTG